MNEVVQEHENEPMDQEFLRKVQRLHDEQVRRAVQRGLDARDD